MMDPGFTEHSGCPVLDGEKWIATVWMREGVSLERPQVCEPSLLVLPAASYLANT